MSSLHESRSNAFHKNAKKVVKTKINPENFGKQKTYHQKNKQDKGM